MTKKNAPLPATSDDDFEDDAYDGAAESLMDALQADQDAFERDNEKSSTFNDPKKFIEAFRAMKAREAEDEKNRTPK